MFVPCEYNHHKGVDCTQEDHDLMPSLQGYLGTPILEVMKLHTFCQSKIYQTLFLGSYLMLSGPNCKG